MRKLPLDHPLPGRPHRVYVALTNSCNRSCPWCSTYSSPSGKTYIGVDQFKSVLPDTGTFQLQLEGGEPTIHPRFWEFVRVARAHPSCERIILCTNGVVLPRDPGRLTHWVANLGAPLTIKISFNHYLMDRDPGLLRLCRSLLGSLEKLGGDRSLVINVRLRRGYDDDDRRVSEAIDAAGLAEHSNIFFLQAYGLAKDEEGWLPPSPVSDNFTLVNPDGSKYGPDLIARSEAMRILR
ncbi:MAG TPA: radical SAM protein [Blastocatellia bacterium]